MRGAPVGGVVEAIRTSILQDETFAGYEVDGTEARCVAEATASEA